MQCRLNKYKIHKINISKEKYLQKQFSVFYIVQHPTHIFNNGSHNMFQWWTDWHYFSDFWFQALDLPYSWFQIQMIGNIYFYLVV